MSNVRRKTNRALPGTMRSKPPEPTDDEPPTLNRVDLEHTSRAMFTIDEAKLAELPVPDELSVRDAAAPPAGYRYTLDGRLVPFIKTSLAVTDPVAQGIFCEVLEVTGSFRTACDAIGVRNAGAVKAYLGKDIDFAESVEAAADRHRESLYAHAVKRATVGYQVPIIGGKEKDKVVAYENRFSDSLLSLLLKRHFPEFREASQKGTNVTINQPTVNMISKEDFKALTREQRDAMRTLISPPPLDVDRSGVIDTNATEVTAIPESDPNVEN